MDTLRRRRMIGLLRALAPQEGYTLTPLPDIRLLRVDRPLSLTPVLYEPGIVIVVQGRKRGFLGDEVFVYDDQHYLVVYVPVPFTMETDASADEPLLAIYFRLDHAMAAELCIQIDELHGASSATPRGLYSSPMENALAASVQRLLEALATPPEGGILGPALVREIYYPYRRPGRIVALGTGTTRQVRHGGARDPHDPQPLQRDAQHRRACE
jgi:hypothetical protein